MILILILVIPVIVAGMTYFSFVISSHITKKPLSPSSWHMRYMHWIWGYTHNNFRNMCPYAWLTVFNISFAIPIITFKLLYKMCEKLVKQLAYLADVYEKHCTQKEKEWYEQMLKKITEELENDKKNGILETLWRKRYDPSSKYLSTKEYDLLAYHSTIQFHCYQSNLRYRF